MDTSEETIILQSILLSSILDGKAPIEKAKLFCSQLPQDEMFRWKCEIAIQLKIGKPNVALELTEVFKNGNEYPEDIQKMIEAAKNHIEIDKLFLEAGITPSPPLLSPPDKNFSFENFKCLLQSSKIIGMEKDETGHTMQLPSDLREKLIVEFDSYNGQFTYADYEKLSKKYNITVARLKVYFNNRRKWHRKQKTQQTKLSSILEPGDFISQTANSKNPPVDLPF